MSPQREDARRARSPRYQALPAPLATREPSPDPFAGGEVARFASNTVALGAAQSMFDGNWRPDEDGIPRYVHQVRGTKMRGEVRYYIIVPDSVDAQVAQKELAFEIMRSLGADTAWLHMLMLAHAIECPAGGEFVIPRRRLFELYGFQRTEVDGRTKVRKDLTLTQRDEHCRMNVAKIQHIGVHVAHLTVPWIKSKTQDGKSTPFRFSSSLGPLWELSFHESGQGEFTIERDADGQEHTSSVITYHDWYLVGRPGSAWAELFLSDDPERSSLRQFGTLAKDMIAKIDRNRTPLAAALAIMLTFHARIQLERSVRSVKVRDLLEFSGIPIEQTNRGARHQIANQIFDAIRQVRAVGWRIPLDDWPANILPDDLDPVDTCGAERILNGSEASPKGPRPTGYWGILVNLDIQFTPPDLVIEGNSSVLLTSSRREEKPLAELYNSSQLVEDLQWLKSIGVLQSEVAAKLEITSSLISQWKKGSKNIPLDKARALRQLIGEHRRWAGRRLTS